MSSGNSSSTVKNAMLLTIHIDYGQDRIISLTAFFQQLHLAKSSPPKLHRTRRAPFASQLLVEEAIASVCVGYVGMCG